MNQARETDLLPITNQDINSNTSASLQRNSGLTKLLGSVTWFFTSSRLLVVFSFVNGLRDPRKDGFWAAVFTTAMVVTDLMFLAIELVVCLGLSMTTLLYLPGFLSGLLSHFMFLFCLFKLDNGRNTIKPNDTYSLNNRPFWMKTNALLVLSGLALLSITFLSLIVDENELRIYYDALPINIILSIFVWRSIANCCLFGMIMMALSDCVKRCENEIKNLHSDEVNDAISRHQHLCARVFSTSDTLTPWFINNWLTVVFMSVFYTGISRNTFHSWEDSFINMMWFIWIAFMFLYPYYSAASVTNKCRQILIDMNTRRLGNRPPI